MLSPELKSGQVVIRGNLAAHKGERVRRLIEARGCELSYLPPYSPDLNPIEEAFSKVKDRLRRARVRTRATLLEALGAGAFQRSMLETPEASSSIAATEQRSHPYHKHRQAPDGVSGSSRL